MNKKEIISKIVLQMEKDLEMLTAAALATYEAAIHEESKSEDQYDTRGLEASYLAGAQSRRLEELQQLIALFKFLDIKAFSPQDRIASTAVVELACEGKKSYFLIMPKGGGITVQYQGKTIQVVTPQSPLGEALIGKQAGDEIDVEINKHQREYEVLAVI